MCIHGSAYCDVALPVPIDTVFTYTIPQDLRKQAKTGTRVLVPFGSRKLTGVILLLHGNQPSKKTRDIFHILDDEPRLTTELIKLAHWIAEYYSAPIGEVFKTMLPLASPTRIRKVISLTDIGHTTISQFTEKESDEPVVQILHALKKQPLTENVLRKKVSGAENILKKLQKRRWISTSSSVIKNDPLRARSGTLFVSQRVAEEIPSELNRGQRWLLDRLQKDPGPHCIDLLIRERRDVKQVSKKLFSMGLINLWRDFSGSSSKEKTSLSSKRVSLNNDQKTALNALSASISASKYQTFLLHGVTGSGKTEVYLRAIEKTLKSGRDALMLVPEIALTPAVADEFYTRFGNLAAVFHSAFSSYERSEQWRRLSQSEARVAIGTRSAVFAPLTNLGLIIVDEEHDSSYKQEETPRYSARDVAIMRAKKIGATVILGSATPSLESRYNTEIGKYNLLQMPERIYRRPLPDVEIVDMRLEFSKTGKQQLFSSPLDKALRSRLVAGEQVIVLLNRRGFSNFVVCRSCGERIECQNCSVTLTFHSHANKLICHYCDYTEPKPDTCPSCRSEYIYFMGSGAEKVAELLQELLPKARIARLDRDSVRNRRQYESILADFRNHKYDILVGTQMIAKGHDIPNVTLVGVVAADVGLGMPDFRAAERTFQILTQVAGRAGRGHLKGKVLLQTSNPDHYAIQLAAAQDYDSFYKKELSFRHLLQYPPYTPMAILIIRSKNMEEAHSLSKSLGKYLHAKTPKGIRLLGPANAPFARLKRDYRCQFIIKSKNRMLIAKVISLARQFSDIEGWPSTALVIDVDPVSIM